MILILQTWRGACSKYFCATYWWAELYIETDIFFLPLGNLAETLLPNVLSFIPKWFSSSVHTLDTKDKASNFCSSSIFLIVLQLNNKSMKIALHILINWTVQNLSQYIRVGMHSFGKFSRQRFEALKVSCFFNFWCLVFPVNILYPVKVLICV